MDKSTRGKVALLTGATGFIGSHLASFLAANNWTVHLVCRPGSIVPDAARESHFVRHDHDGTTEDLIRIVSVARPTTVFHLASLFLAQHQPSDIARLIQSNVLFSCQLLEAMDVNGIKHIVNTGTSWQHAEEQVIESAPHPVNLYAATKQAFEALLNYYVTARDFHAVTLKLYDTYGPKDPRPKLFHLLNKISKTGETLDMSPGDQILNLVHIDDVVSAFVRADEIVHLQSRSSHERYFVRSDEAVSLKQLASLFTEATGRSLNINFGGRPYREREVMRPVSGQTVPGWKAKISLLSGLKSALDPS